MELETRMDSIKPGFLYSGVCPLLAGHCLFLSTEFLTASNRLNTPTLQVPLLKYGAQQNENLYQEAGSKMLGHGTEEKEKWHGFLNPVFTHFLSLSIFFYFLPLNICILLSFKFLFYLTEKYLFRLFISGEIGSVILFKRHY